MIFYVENKPTSAKAISDLRQSVGWNRMEECYKSPTLTSYFHIACYDDKNLIGYVDVVSNGVTDAYIQDLTVYPEYQGKGIGTELMNRAISHLKDKKIFMISVLFDEKLLTFYKRFGFKIMLCGQMQTYEME